MKSGKKKRRASAAEGLSRLNRRLMNWAGRGFPGRKRVESCLEILYTEKNVQEKTEEFYLEKHLLLLKIFAAGILTSAAAVLAAGGRELLLDGRFLPRQEEAYTRELELTEPESGRTGTLEVTVEPRERTAEENRRLLEKAREELETCILGENSSLEEVRSPLILKETVGELPVMAQWEQDSARILNPDGSIRTDRLTEEGTVTELTVRLCCGEEEERYRFAVHVLPPLLSAEESWIGVVSQAVAEMQEKGGKEELKELPETVQEKKILWSEKKTSPAGWMVLLTILCGICVYRAKDQELEKQIGERERQMKRDYAKIVSKLVLLTEAGSAVRTAWETIVRDYQKKKEDGRTELRWAYEEMALAGREMQNGTAETRAYENFGMRCRIPCYMKLAALLGQNVRKGGKGLGELLYAETAEAFEQRKAGAVSQGEEAATKLLFPLILTLLAVMLLVIAPAGMAMKI